MCLGTQQCGWTMTTVCCRNSKGGQRITSGGWTMTNGGWRLADGGQMLVGWVGYRGHKFVGKASFVSLVSKFSPRNFFALFRALPAFCASSMSIHFAGR